MTDTTQTAATSAIELEDGRKVVERDVQWTGKTHVMNRRQLLAGLAAGSVVPMVSGCETNEALGRQQFLLVSDGQLAQLAASSWKAALDQTPQTRDPVARGRVSRVGEKIILAADRRFPDRGYLQRDWEFAVFEEDTLNAWVMPGGKVGFYTGILDIMANDSQVATVMGHEVGHDVGRHSAERYSQQIAAQGALIAGNIAIAESGSQYQRELAAIFGAGITFGYLLPYSRKHESEADLLGLDMMVDAGYNPVDSIRLWENMIKASSGSGPRPPEFMSTHPDPANRIVALRNHMINRGYVSPSEAFS